MKTILRLTRRTIGKTVALIGYGFLTIGFTLVILGEEGVLSLLHEVKVFWQHTHR